MYISSIWQFILFILSKQNLYNNHSRQVTTIELAQFMSNNT